MSEGKLDLCVVCKTPTDYVCMLIPLHLYPVCSETCIDEALKIYAPRPGRKPKRSSS